LAPTVTAEDQAKLDELLLAWEQRSRAIKTFECKFKRWQYNLQFGDPNHPYTEGEGELRYSRPDKGMFRVTGEKTWIIGQNGQGTWSEPAEAEHWICDGSSIYILDPKQKLIVEHPLPKELQGEAIARGPLPFLFNVTAAELKERYAMRVIAAPSFIPRDQAAGQHWIEIYPKWRQDSAEFSRAFVVLSRDEIRPLAIMLIHTNGNSSRYAFREPATNDPLRIIKDFFVAPRTPFGWKRVVEPLQTAPQATADSAHRVAPPGGSQDLH
jgi:TIGR03009 family protein